MLSNFWTSFDGKEGIPKGSDVHAPWKVKYNAKFPKDHLFILDGLKWASSEIYLHAGKFKHSDPEIYRLFSLDSNTVIAKLPALAKKVASSLTILRYYKSVLRDDIDSKSNGRLIDR